MKRVIRLALALLASLLSTSGALAAERLLFVLGAADTTGKPVHHEVREKTGLQTPKEVRAYARWHVVPGETVNAAAAPSPRVVDLYGGTPQSPELVARVLVRYFGAAGKWIPHYQLTEEPAVVHRGGRWAPLTIGQGMPGLIIQHGGTLPNADGFFPRIEFSLTTGSLPLGAWLVR
jgi:hypothetical protein